jgi:putative redox protein
METIEVRHLHKDRFSVRVRGHVLMVDQPVADGGDDMGPTPTELFVAGLASCVGFYTERFLRRHGLPADGLRIGCGFDFAKDRPARVSAVRLTVDVPVLLTPGQREALERVVEHCTVHNSIRQAPDVRIELDVLEIAA